MSTRIGVLAGVAIVALAAAGFMYYKGSRDLGAARIEAIEPAPAPAVMRPVFSLKDVDGNERSITEWDGKALVVNFWATWCAPCRREIPLLKEIQDEVAAQDIQIIGIAIDEPAEVSRYAREMSFNYPILVGEQEGIDAAEAFGADVVALPLTVFTDHDGRVIEIHAGEINRSEIQAIIEKLIP